MTHTALAPSVSTATLPAIDKDLEAKIDRGIEILTNLPPQRPSSIEDRRARIANFKALAEEFGITEGEAVPMMRQVAEKNEIDARLCLKRKLRDQN